MQRLLDWLSALFRRRRPQIVPAFPVVSAMKRKDPELFDDIGHMTVPDGIARWRQKYPEDFADAD